MDSDIIHTLNAVIIHLHSWRYQTGMTPEWKVGIVLKLNQANEIGSLFSNEQLTSIWASVGFLKAGATWQPGLLTPKMFTIQGDSRILVAFKLDCKPTHPVQLIYAYKIVQKFCNSTLKVTVVSEFWSNQNKHDKNKCDNNLMRVIHKAGDCHLHHEWQ